MTVLEEFELSVEEDDERVAVASVETDVRAKEDDDIRFDAVEEDVGIDDVKDEVVAEEVVEEDKVVVE